MVYRIFVHFDGEAWRSKRFKAAVHWQATDYMLRVHFIIKICAMINQDESKVGNDMLLVSEVLCHLKIRKCQCLIRHLSQVYWWCYKDLMNLLRKPEYRTVHKCLVSNFIDVCLKNKKTKQNKKKLKPVTCRYRLPTHSARSHDTCM